MPPEIAQAIKKIEDALELFKNEALDLIRRHRHDDLDSVILRDGTRDILISFETGEKGDVKIYFPYAVEIKKIRGMVVKAIAATDNGTITGANQDGASATGVITATASDPLGTEYSVSPTTNNRVPKDSFYKLTGAKTTAGGKVQTTLEFIRL